MKGAWLSRAHIHPTRGIRIDAVAVCRGMQSTMYVKLADGVTVEDLRKKLVESYASEPFVRVLEPGVVPHTRHVRGSNFCLMNVFPDRLSNRAIVISVIDNLVKGASGQAMQVGGMAARGFVASA